MDLNYPVNGQNIKYRSIKIYKTKDKDKYILVGHDPLEEQYAIIVILLLKGQDPRAKNLNDILKEDPNRFATFEEVKLYMQKTYKDCIFHTEATGIIGFIRHLQGYYMIIFRKTIPTAKIGKHKIFSLDYTEVIELFDVHPSSQSAEDRYKKLLSEYDMEIGFYSSYTYDVTKNLPQNILENWETHKSRQQDVDTPTQMSPLRQVNSYSSIEGAGHQFTHEKDVGTFNNIFLWNKFALEGFDRCVRNKKWILPIVHGYCDQITIKTSCSMFSICLISRRARHHAGARYLTRGINEEGFVANYVETEQIVIDLDANTKNRSTCSSFVQVRGSAPVYWYQKPDLLIPKPPIKINVSDPYLLATKKHICDLVALYGQQIFLVNLVKNNEHVPREQLLAEEFYQSILAVKEEIQSQTFVEIGYLHFDMKNQLKLDKEEFIKKCYSLAYYCIMKTGVFLLKRQDRHQDIMTVELQNGIIRSNCIDCLDRTNTFQQLIGELALKIQLAKINETQLKYKALEVSEGIYADYREMYEQMGDIISLQYGSSNAHKQNIGDKQSSKRFEFLTSLKRHFKNNVSDQNKQHQIDVFLGHHQPSLDEPYIWDIQSYVTLFPDLVFLKSYAYDKEWYLPALQQFYEQSHISSLEQAHMGGELKYVVQSKVDLSYVQQTTKKNSHKKNHFNFEVILSSTLKSDKRKAKEHCLFKFLVKLQSSGVRYKQKSRKPYTQYNFEAKMKKNYNDFIIVEDVETTSQVEVIKQDSKEQPIKLTQHQDRRFDIDPHEVGVLRAYLQPKSYHDFCDEAQNSDAMTFKMMSVDEEQDLYKEMTDYVEANLDNRYCDFAKPQQQTAQHAVFDLLSLTQMDERTKLKMDQMHFTLNSDAKKQDYEQQLLHAAISVQTPKKQTIEQKKLKIIESLCKQSFAQTQKIKVNRI